jgi:hypothetical protein
MGTTDHNYDNGRYRVNSCVLNDPATCGKEGMMAADTPGIIPWPGDGTLPYDVVDPITAQVEWWAPRVMGIMLISVTVVALAIVLSRRR